MINARDRYTIFYTVDTARRTYANANPFMRSVCAIGKEELIAKIEEVKAKGNLDSVYNGVGEIVKI